MPVARQVMTDEQRKSVALEYLKAFDNGGTTSDGGSILDLFAEDAQVYFPKWGLATGREQIGVMFGDVGGTLASITHDYASFNWVMTGTDTFACEGTSHGEHRDEGEGGRKAESHAPRLPVRSPAPKRGWRVRESRSRPRHGPDGPWRCRPRWIRR